MSNENVDAVRAMLKNSNETVSDLHRVVRGSAKNITQGAQDISIAMRHLKNAAGNAENLSESIDQDPAALLFPPEEKGIPAP